MPDETQKRSASADEGQEAVLAAMRGIAVLALSPDEPVRDDHDVIDHLVDGLLALPAVVRVRRVRGRAGEEQDDAAASPPSGGSVLEEAVVDPAAPAPETMPLVSPDGRVLSLTASLQARTGDLDVFSIEAHPDGPGLSELECAAATTLRDQAAVALALRATRAQARLDPLTGCLNHGAMLTQIEEEIARAQRSSGRLACVMLDLDDFKTVNERHGHAAGNSVLRAVAAAMEGACRTYDICCRYGGDEFVVILPDANDEEAARGAERVRSAIEATRVAYQGEPIGVGATAGVAEWRPGESAAALLARVDKTLMDAKAAGKGTIGRA